MESTSLRECVEDAFEASSEIKEIIETGTLQSRKKERSNDMVESPKKTKAEFEAIISTNHPKSLFDQVISSAKTLVYDLNVGQYIAKSDILDVDEAGRIKTSFDSAPNSVSNKVSLSVLKSPKNQKISPGKGDKAAGGGVRFSPAPSPVPMLAEGVPLAKGTGGRSSMVGEVQHADSPSDTREVSDMTNMDVAAAHPKVRNNVGHHLVDIASSTSSYMHKMEDQKASLEKAMCISIKSQRKADFGAFSHRGKKDVTRKTPCGLCGHKFPECELLGKVTNRGIMRWRQERNTDIGLTDATLRPENLYMSAMVCLFCLQFFDDKVDSSFGDVMVETAAMEDLVFGDNRKEADLELMNGVKVSASEMKKSMKKTPAGRKKSSSAVSAPTRVESLPPAQDNAFSLLHKKPDPVRVSMQNEQLARSKAVDPNKPSIIPLRPLSRMADDMTKTKLQLRGLTSGTVAAGIAPGTVASDLRSKYTSVAKIMKSQFATEREDRELTKKLARRKMKFHKQLKEEKLTNEDLGFDQNHLHVDTHIRKVKAHGDPHSLGNPSIISPSPQQQTKTGKEKRNAQGETEAEHHERIANEGRRDSAMAFVSFLTEVRYNNHIKQMDNFVEHVNSVDDSDDQEDDEDSIHFEKLQAPLNKSPSFFHLGVDEKVDDFWDDRSMPRALGQRKNPNEPKFVRSVHTKRGALKDDDDEDDDLAMPGKPKKKSAEEIMKEAKFQKLVKTALRRKSTIGRSTDSGGSQGSSRGKLGFSDLIGPHGTVAVPPDYMGSSPEPEAEHKGGKITSLRALVDEATHPHAHEEDSVLPSIFEQTRTPVAVGQRESSRKVRKKELPKSTMLPQGAFGPPIERPKPQPKPKPKHKGNAKARSRKFRPQPEMGASASAPVVAKSTSAGSPVRAPLVVKSPVTVDAPSPVVESKFHKMFANAGFFPGVMETVKTHRDVKPPELAQVPGDAVPLVPVSGAGDDYGDDFEEDEEEAERQEQGQAVGSLSQPVDKHKLRPEHTSYQVNTPDRDFTEDGLLTSRTNMHPPTKLEMMNFPGFEMQDEDQNADETFESCDDQEFQKMWFNAENVEFVAENVDQDYNGSADNFEFDEDLKKSKGSAAARGGAAPERRLSRPDMDFVSISGSVLQPRAVSRGSRPGSRNATSADNIRLISGSVKGISSREGSRCQSRSGSRAGSRSLFSRERNQSPTKSVVELSGHKEHETEM